MSTKPNTEVPRFRYLAEAIKLGYAKSVMVDAEPYWRWEDHPKYWWKKVCIHSLRERMRIIVCRPFDLWFYDHWMRCDEVGKMPFFGAESIRYIPTPNHAK